MRLWCDLDSLAASADRFAGLQTHHPRQRASSMPGSDIERCCVKQTRTMSTSRLGWRPHRSDIGKSRAITATRPTRGTTCPSRRETSPAGVLLLGLIGHRGGGGLTSGGRIWVGLNDGWIIPPWVCSEVLQWTVHCWWAGSLCPGDSVRTATGITLVAAGLRHARRTDCPERRRILEHGQEKGSIVAIDDPPPASRSFKGRTRGIVEDRQSPAERRGTGFVEPDA